MKITRSGLATGRPRRARARWSTTRSTTSARTCPSSRCSTSSTSSSSSTAKTPSPSTTTAARASAGPAAWSSTAGPTVRSRPPTCQLHMREFSDGDTIEVEPWRAGPFKVLKDLVVDRTAFDRIIQAGGYVSVNTGAAPDAASIAGAQGRRRPRVRERDLHQLRRLRRGLPERRGDAVHQRQGHPPEPAAAGSAGARDPGAAHGRRDGRRGLRRLHQRRRVRRRVPEGHPVRQHRQPQPRVPAGRAAPAAATRADAGTWPRRGAEPAAGPSRS